MTPWVAATEAAPPSVMALDVLAAFVAVNTLMYVCLALVKMLPRFRVPRAYQRMYWRSETRSIYPDDPP